MGSLPNLTDLHSEKAERRDNERERDLARERARELEFSREREKDRLPIFIHQVGKIIFFIFFSFLSFCYVVCFVEFIIV